MICMPRLCSNSIPIDYFNKYGNNLSMLIPRIFLGCEMNGKLEPNSLFWWSGLFVINIQLVCNRVESWLKLDWGSPICSHIRWHIQYSGQLMERRFPPSMPPFNERRHRRHCKQMTHAPAAALTVQYWHWLFDFTWTCYFALFYLWLLK